MAFHKVTTIEHYKELRKKEGYLRINYRHPYNVIKLEGDSISLNNLIRNLELIEEWYRSNKIRTRLQIIKMDYDLKDMEEDLRRCLKSKFNEETMRNKEYFERAVDCSFDFEAQDNYDLEQFIECLKQNRKTLDMLFKICFFTVHFYKLEIIIVGMPKHYMELFNRKSKPKQRKRKRKSIPKGIRHSVFVRDKYTCQECGARKGDIKPNGEIVKIEIDHILPLSKGGTNDMENLQTLCWECNHNKSDTLW